MSIYNMIAGMNQLVVFYMLPVLGRHPDEYPRFRDAFYGDENKEGTEGKIIVYTRTGGGNREAHAEENDEITQMDGYCFDYDDDFDSTYANFVFDVPVKWLKDIELLTTGKGNETSDEYKQLLYDTYPKIADKIKESFTKDTDGKEVKNDTA